MKPPTRSRPARGTPFGTPPRGSRTLTEHLAANDAFARLSGLAERLRRLQSMLDDCLPVYLAPGAHVANLKRGKLVIHADSGAVAVKLKQLAPRLVESFIQQGQEVTGIEVRVQPRRGSIPGARRIPAKVLGTRSKQSLTSLAAGLDESSPVRRALEKLLKNAQ